MDAEEGDGGGGDGGGSEVICSPARQVLLISAGASHSIALLSGNVVCSWGRGEDGQLGLGDAEDRPFPTQMNALDGHEIISVTCGADHATAYSATRTQVYSWGWGDFGRLGHGNSSDLFIPQRIKALDGLKVKQIACGDSHCLALSMEGEVLSWGRNQNGQLGLGTTEDSLVPQKIQSFQGVSIKMLAAGAEHTAAVTEDGELYGWGWGRYGNLGLGDRNDCLLPHKVSAFHGEKMVQIACGWRHTISVTSTGGLYTYGWSKYGQLGHGDFEDHLVPHKLMALHENYITEISGGWRHTMALTSDGKLYGWGWNKVMASEELMQNRLEADGDVDHAPEIEFNSYGNIIGNKDKLSKRSLALLKTSISVTYGSWSDIPEELINDIWETLQKEFNIPDALKKSMCKTFAEQLKSWRNRLRKKYFQQRNSVQIASLIECVKRMLQANQMGHRLLTVLPSSMRVLNFWHLQN